MAKVKEWTEEIWYHLVYPAAGEDPEETFHETLASHEEYKPLHDALQAIMNKKTRTPPGVQTKRAIGSADRTTSLIKRSYTEFIAYNQEILDDETQAHKQEAKRDIKRAEQAIKNIEAVEGLLAKLQKMLDVKPPRHEK